MACMARSFLPPDLPAAANFAVAAVGAGSGNHSLVGTTLGRQHDDEFSRLGTIHHDVPSRCARPVGRSRFHLQDAHVLGYVDIPDLSIYPPRACVERFWHGSLSIPSISDRA